MPDTLSGEALRRFRHDLRTPLNHVIGFSEIMMEDARDRDRPGALLALRAIRAAGFTLLQLTEASLPSGVDRMTPEELGAAAAALRNSAVALLSRCVALDETGDYRNDSEGAENLRTIETTLRRLTAIVDSRLAQPV